MIKTYKGLNSESMLGNGKVDRKITKYSDGENEYILIDGEEEVYVCFKDFTINEQCFRRDFINTKKISREDFNNLNNTSTNLNLNKGCEMEFTCFDKGRMGRRTICGEDGYYFDKCKLKAVKDD